MAPHRLIYLTWYIFVHLPHMSSIVIDKFIDDNKWSRFLPPVAEERTGSSWSMVAMVTCKVKSLQSLEIVPICIPRCPKMSQLCQILPSTNAFLQAGESRWKNWCEVVQRHQLHIFVCRDTSHQTNIGLTRLDPICNEYGNGVSEDQICIVDFSKNSNNFLNWS